MPEHDYAIVTSQSAARVIAERGIRLRRVIAIGRKTAEVLKNYDVITPSRYDSSTIVEEFREELTGKKVIAIRSDRGSEELRKLAEICDFTDIVAYRIVKLHGEEQRRVAKLVEDCFFDVVVFSSRMIVESFLDLCSAEKLKRKIVIALGPPTAEKLKEYSIKALVPEEYTFDGVIELLRDLRGAGSRC